MRINGFPSNNMFNLSNNLNHAKAAEKLASGQAINRAADNAAGLAVSEMLRGQIRGDDQAIRNSYDGSSMIQTAEGALNEDHAMLDRMKELSVQAANGTYTDEQRGFIQAEVNQLRTEINNISNTTSFNNKVLLDGSSKNTAFQTGPNELQTINTTFPQINSGTLNINPVDVTNIQSAGKGITSVDNGISRISSERSSMGATMNRLDHTINNLGVASENQTAAESRIRDTDMAAMMMEYTRTNILDNVNVAMAAQGKQNAGQVLRLLGY